MSRLSRLRSFWRSLRRGQIRDGGWSPHRAVNLLPAEYRDTGTLLGDGSRVLSASTGTKERGTRTPATDTLVVCSSYRPRGESQVDVDGQIVLRPWNSFIARGSSGRATADPGASGAPRGPAA